MNGSRSSIGLVALALTLPLAAACGPESTSPVPGENKSPEAAIPQKTSTLVEIRKPTPRAPTRQGGAIVRSPVEAALYLADEDHQKLRRIPLPFNSDEETTDVDMPGAPAQVLALAKSILVTIRDPG